MTEFKDIYGREIKIGQIVLSFWKNDFNVFEVIGFTKTLVKLKHGDNYYIYKKAPGNLLICEDKEILKRYNEEKR